MFELSPDKCVEMILQGKYALITNSDQGEVITQFMNKRYSIPFHLSEQQAYSSNGAILMRKSLSKQMIMQINRLYVINSYIKLINPII